MTVGPGAENIVLLLPNQMFGKIMQYVIWQCADKIHLISFLKTQCFFFFCFCFLSANVTTALWTIVLLQPLTNRSFGLSFLVKNHNLFPLDFREWHFLPIFGGFLEKANHSKMRRNDVFTVWWSIKKVRPTQRWCNLFHSVSLLMQSLRSEEKSKIFQERLLTFVHDCNCVSPLWCIITDQKKSESKKRPSVALQQ